MITYADIAQQQRTMNGQFAWTSSRVAKAATSTIPIVFVRADAPVEIGQIWPGISGVMRAERGW